MTTPPRRPGDRRGLTAPVVPPATLFSEGRRGEIAALAARGALERVRRGVYLAPVTTLERTVVDCARTLAPDQALVIADSALRGGADPALVSTILEESAGRRGVRRAREVVGLADARAESAGESVLRWIVHAAGLPAPEIGLRVPTRRGDSWLDLAWPGHRVALEFDGAVKYSGGEYGDPTRRLFDEKLRQDALEEAGWLVLRVVWEDLLRPEVLAARIRSALRARAPRSR